MAQSITHEPSETQQTEPVASRLGTVLGNRFPRKCASGGGSAIPRDPEVCCVVKFGIVKPSMSRPGAPVRFNRPFHPRESFASLILHS